MLIAMERYIAPGRVRAGEDDRSTGQIIVRTTHDGQLTMEKLSELSWVCMLEDM